MAKADSNYNYEVVKLMNEDSKQEYCFILDKCDDIVANMRKVDESKMEIIQLVLIQIFLRYRKIILERRLISFYCYS